MLHDTLQRRLRKELLELLTNPINGIHIDEDKVAKNINEWIVQIDGAEGTIYEVLLNIGS